MCYVTRREIKKYKIIFDNLMQNIRKEVKNEGITFTYNLVGSAKRNLVIRHHNKGFDCDYQIFIQMNKKNLGAKSIKKLFIDLINRYKNNDFDNCEDKTTAIKLKKKENDKIIFSYDIVIMMVINDKYQVIRKTDDNKTYKFEELMDMSKFNESYKKIQGQAMWESLREEYYKLKISNKTNKFSYQILHEAVNNVLKEFNR